MNNININKIDINQDIDSRATIFTSLHPAGYWYMKHGEIKISTKFKPNLWNRFWFLSLFGIKWIKEKNN